MSNISSISRPDSLHVIMTGGTIDSKYNGLLDTVTPRENSIIPEFLESVRMQRSVSFTEICMKDSRTVTDDDRAEIALAASESVARRILVTHGTYTMPETARYLEAQLLKTDKVVVITGSMIPIDGFTMSDAGFNLGYAVAQADHLAPGVYLCINGETFSPKEAAKLIREGRFGSLFGEGES